jgi:hypothetical protein
VAAREKVRVAAALAALPQIDAALARGELSYAKVRARTRVATARNEELLLAQARGTTGAELERICSGFRRVVGARLTDEDHRYVRRRTMTDGTVRIEMRLLPDEAERIWQALSETRRQLQAKDRVEDDSAEASKRGDSAGPGHKNDSAEACLIEAAAQPSMVDAAVAIAEASLAAAARPMDTPAVARTDARGNVLDIGRRRRTVSPALLRALRLRDRRCGTLFRPRRNPRSYRSQVREAAGAPA